MATSAFDSFDDEDRAEPPIVRHPAFPAVVAAWFATLLGLGTLVLPVLLLERLVGATGLPALLPAAAAPLGITARALIALAAALAGAAAGWVLARRVARSRDVRVEPQRARYPAGLRRPISVREELGDEYLFEDFGLPVPGRESVDFEEREALGTDSASALFDERGDGRMGSSDPVPAWPGEEIEPAVAAIEPAGAAIGADELLPHEGMGEPLAFTAPSLARREAGVHDGDQRPSSQSRKPAPLDGLGLEYLAERLRASIERRREWVAEACEVNAAAHGLPSRLEAAPAEEAAQAMAAYFGRPTAIGSDVSPVVRSARPDAERDVARFDAMTPALRVPEPPPTPGHVETDAALRAALANLQRMSGRA